MHSDRERLNRSREPIDTSEDPSLSTVQTTEVNGVSQSWTSSQPYTPTDGFGMNSNAYTTNVLGESNYAYEGGYSASSSPAYHVAGGSRNTLTMSPEASTTPSTAVVKDADGPHHTSVSFSARSNTSSHNSRPITRPSSVVAALDEFTSEGHEVEMQSSKECKKPSGEVNSADSFSSRYESVSPVGRTTTPGSAFTKYLTATARGERHESSSVSPDENPGAHSLRFHRHQRLSADGGEGSDHDEDDHDNNSHSAAGGGHSFSTATEPGTPLIHSQHGSITASAFNLAATALGAGTVGLPYAIAHTGLVLGPILLLVSAAMALYSIVILIMVAQRTGKMTYESVALHTFGINGKRFTAISIVTLTWFATVLYVKITASIASPIHAELVSAIDFPPGVWGGRLIQFLLWFCFMYPLSLFKQINALRYASVVGVCSVLLLAMALTVEVARGSPAVAGEPEGNHSDGVSPSSSKSGAAVISPPSDWTPFQAFNNMRFAFGAQTTAFSVYSGLRHASVIRMTWATFLGMLICFVIYCYCGVVGLFAFGRDVGGNALEHFQNPMRHWHAVLAFVGILVTVVVSYPILLLPSRDAVIQLVLGYESVHTCPDKKRYALVTLLAVGSLLLGLFIPSVNLMFGILGGVFGTLIGFALPAVFALRAGWRVADVGVWHVAGVWFLLVSGIVLGPMGTIVSIVLEFE